MPPPTFMNELYGENDSGSSESERPPSERTQNSESRIPATAATTEPDCVSPVRPTSTGATRPGSVSRFPREEARRMARLFGPALGAALQRLEISKNRFAELAGLDSATIDRLIEGVNRPTYESAIACLRALWTLDHAEAYTIGRDLVRLIYQDHEQDTDVNRDGVVDREDLLIAAGRIVHCADELLNLTLAGISAHGYVDDAESIKVIRANQDLRDASQRHQQIVEILHAAGARARR